MRILVRPRFRRAVRGFTLIEAIATIVILAALGSIASAIIVEASDGYVSARVHAQLHTEASIAMDRIVRELRNIPLDENASDVVPDIDSIDDESISWNDDYSISLSGSDIEIVEDGGPERMLLSDVSALNIQVFDDENDTLSQPRNGAQCDAIRRVQVTMTLSRHGVTETLRSKVFLRSTMAGSAGGS